MCYKFNEPLAINTKIFQKMDHWIAKLGHGFTVLKSAMTYLWLTLDG